MALIDEHMPNLDGSDTSKVGGWQGSRGGLADPISAYRDGSEREDSEK